MRVCIHRGSKQIGGSCVEVESCGQRLLIDFGLPLDAEENSRQYLPKIAGLDGSDPSPVGCPNFPSPPRPFRFTCSHLSENSGRHGSRRSSDT